MSFFEKLKNGLNKTKENLDKNLNNLFSKFKKIDEDLIEELEDTLILSDIGVGTTDTIIDELRKNIKEKNIKEPELVKDELKRVLVEVLNKSCKKNIEFEEYDGKRIILVTGVNGVGKTTSIGKIANIYKKSGKKVLIIAADTYRAAAEEQLEVWAKRSSSELYKGNEKEDPASVAYKGVEKGIKENYDIIICDTAGRIHNKKNLMEELAKINRSIDKVNKGEYLKENLLVIDGTVGQNAIQQAKAFNEVTNLTGLVVTKLDGTSKGGAIITVSHETNLPIRYIGVGEQIDELERFNSTDFINSIIE